MTTTGVVDPRAVMQIRRGDDFAPDTVEIVLDRPLPADQQIRFTFDDGTTVSEVVYTLVPPPPILTTSSWGAVIFLLVVLMTTTIVLRPRSPAP